MKKFYNFVDKNTKWIYLGIGIVFALFAVMPLYFINYGNDSVSISGAGLTFPSADIFFGGEINPTARYALNILLAGYLLSLILVIALIVLLFLKNRIKFIKNNFYYFVPIPFMIYLIFQLIFEFKYNIGLYFSSDLHFFLVFYFNLLFLIFSLLILILKLIPLKEKQLS